MIQEDKRKKEVESEWVLVRLVVKMQMIPIDGLGISTCVAWSPTLSLDGTMHKKMNSKS
jgi:hypothetical protein